MLRKTFSRQPGNDMLCVAILINVFTARAVLVDFRPPMDAGTCQNMVQALTDTLMLACNLNGSVRIPLFSLIALGLYPEVSGCEIVYCLSRDAFTGTLPITVYQW